MDKVRIFVVAGSNRGKTTISHILKEALIAADFKSVTLVDTKESTEPKQPIDQRVKTTQERPIEIRVINDPSIEYVLGFQSEFAERVVLALQNAYAQIAALGSPTDPINRAHLREIMGLLEEIRILGKKK